MKPRKPQGKGAIKGRRNAKPPTIFQADAPSKTRAITSTSKSTNDPKKPELVISKKRSQKKISSRPTKSDDQTSKVKTAPKGQNIASDRNSTRRSNRATKKPILFSAPAIHPIASSKIKSEKSKVKSKSLKNEPKSQTSAPNRKRKLSDGENEEPARGKTAKTKKEAAKNTKNVRKEKVKKIKNDRLTQRPHIPYYGENPFIFGKDNEKECQRFVSTTASARLVFRYVRQNAIEKLKKLVADKRRFPRSGLEGRYCYADPTTVEIIAALKEDRALYKTLIDLKKQLNQEQGREPRPSYEPCLLQKGGTGQANFHMLGHRTAQLEMTRGGREGNNALINYESRTGLDNYSEILNLLLQRNISFEMLEHMSSYESGGSVFSIYSAHQHIYEAVRMGNRKLAGRLAESNTYTFNQLHTRTLLNDKEELPKFMPVSVVKMAIDNRKIMPLHTAAINPNTDYLKALMSVEPNYNQPDMDNWYTIHYAAVCEGPGPLQHLLSLEASILLATKKKETPLHCAIRAGRLENVKLLLAELHEISERTRQATGQNETDDEGGDVEVAAPNKKPKKPPSDLITAQLSARNAEGFAPLHLAVKWGRHDIVEYLLTQKHTSLDVDIPTATNIKKLTPLMMACQTGDLEMAELLINTGNAFIDAVDRLKRTPLIHAAMNGQTHLVAMLLRKGASVSSKPDSSGNTAAHYAGWLDVLKLLAQADRDVLKATNSWQLAPLAVAYLKGHIGIVEFLLDGQYSADVDVNAVDNDGCNLLMALIKNQSQFSPPFISSKTFHTQLKYLVDKGAKASNADSFMSNALHYFANFHCKLKSDEPIDDRNQAVQENVKHENDERMTKEEYINCVKLLFDAGADKDAKNADGLTAADIALRTGNLILLEFLYENSTQSLLAQWKTSSGDSNTNVLHYLVDIPFEVFNKRDVWSSLNFCPAFSQYDIKSFITNKIRPNVTDDQIRIWLKERDGDGRTPLVKLCTSIANFSFSTPGQYHYFDKNTPEGRKEYDRQQNANMIETLMAEKFLSYCCDLTRLFVSFYPEGLLPLKEVKTDAEGKLSSIPKSAFEIALNGKAIDDFKSQQSVHKFTCCNKEYELRNPLLFAIVEEVKKTNISLLEQLLMSRDSMDRTPLLYCVHPSVTLQQKKETANFLLSIAQDLPICKEFCAATTKKVNDTSALLLCIEGNLIDVCKNLIETYRNTSNTAVNNVHESQANPIHLHCDAEGKNAFRYLLNIEQPETIFQNLEYFKQLGVPFVADKCGRFPLHYAVDKLRDMDSVDVRLDTIEWLIDNGDKIDGVDVMGRTPLHYAFIPIDDSATHTPKISNAIEPIALVSLLIEAMPKSSLHQRDKFGNTALHYAAKRGANICIVTLLRHGFDVNEKNLVKNTPLALAVLAKHESVALTLIQAKADITAKIFSESDILLKDTLLHFDEKSKWTWIPLRAEYPKPFESNVASFIVENGWQGIIYVVFDLLGKTSTTLLELICGGIERRKHNMVQSLLKMLKEMRTRSAQKSTKPVLNGPTNSDSLESEKAKEVFPLLAKHFKHNNKSGHIGFGNPFGTTSNADHIPDAQKTIMRMLFEDGHIPWLDADGNGTSRCAEIFSEHGGFSGLAELRKLDAEFNESSNWNRMAKSESTKRMVANFIELWNEKGHKSLNEAVKAWLKTATEEWGIDLSKELFEFEEPAFDGMEEAKPAKPVPKKQNVTPLIRAVQKREPTLVKWLIEDMKVDINVQDEQGRNPLMYALMANDEKIVAILFGCDEDTSSGSSSSNPLDGIIAGSSLVNATGEPEPENEESQNEDEDIIRENEVVEDIVQDNDDHETNSQESDGSDNVPRKMFLPSLFPSARPFQFGQFPNTGIFGSSGFGQLPTTSQMPSHSDLNRDFTLSLKRCINLNQTDNAGRSIFHYMVLPNGWENTRLLSAVFGSMTTYKERSNLVLGKILMGNDASGKNSLNLTLELKQYRMRAAMDAIVMAGGEIKKVDKSLFGSKHSPASIAQINFTQDCAVEQCPYNLVEDSRKFFEQTNSKENENGRVEISRPNKNSGYGQTGDIVKEEGTGRLYKVLLNITDLQYGLTGFHNFYRMELIQRRGTEFYILFTNWGRIGDSDGQFQRTPFSKLADAQKEFHSVFKQKSGNDWVEFGQTGQFEEKPGKYRLIPVDEGGQKEISELDLKLKFWKSDQDLKKMSNDEEREFYRVIKDVSNVERMQRKNRTICSYSRVLTPFGKLSRDSILKAKNILDEITNLCLEKDNIRKESEKDTSTEKDNSKKEETTRRILAIYNQQAQLSNKFYACMPLGGYESCSLPIIDSVEIAKNFNKIIEQMLEFEVAGQILTAAAYQQKNVDPFRYISAAVETRLQLMDSTSTESQSILQYIHNSSPNIKVRGIFTVESRHATEMFNSSGAKLHNHKYLWHGTKPENMLSIFKAGLRITPPSAIQCGQAFGEGIYFADTFAKSSSYSTHSADGFKYMFICEVALGNEYYGDDQSKENHWDQNKVVEKFFSDDTKNTLKIFGRQRPNPQFDKTMNTGVVMPLGKLINDRTVVTDEVKFEAQMNYNEYIVKDQKNALARYLKELEEQKEFAIRQLEVLESRKLAVDVVGGMVDDNLTLLINRVKVIEEVTQRCAAVDTRHLVKEQEKRNRSIEGQLLRR
ncbi:ankyrin repeats (3 copies) domain-containing protein [Ditylenchus destructor]|uniref:Poly [ADP-ribose] polymerase n=1 Tax=Ditylenchus destructor TaxID=166010 RepID=A0AAD4MRT8_9BILA|nr:ankyrin repeats (3 copies) domain-containing protein [Ditylenchus destructor]